MITTTIKKKYFDMKMEDLEDSGYFFEFKKQSPFWNTRLKKLIPFKGQNELVLLVGKIPYRFKVVDIFKAHKDFIPEKYQSAINTEYAYVIKYINHNITQLMLL